MNTQDDTQEKSRDELRAINSKWRKILDSRHPGMLSYPVNYLVYVSHAYHTWYIGAMTLGDVRAIAKDLGSYHFGGFYSTYEMADKPMQESHYRALELSLHKVGYCKPLTRLSAIGTTYTSKIHT